MNEDGKVETTDVAPAHRFDEDRLKRYLQGEIKGFGDGLRVRQFPVGQSNPTYELTSGGKKYVLRKKPPGVLLPSAHAVDREYKVMRALQDTDVPVPRALLLCQDPEVIGTDFYVMEMVEGRVFHDPGLPGLSPDERRSVFDDFIRALAALHSVDYEAVGLGEFARPGSYLERQIARWAKQYEASKTEEIVAMDRLMEWLPANLPADQSVAIVHGDYRPGNTIVHPTRPNIMAVLDWELWTIGHPLADLGYHCLYYQSGVASMGDFADLDHKAMGLPTEQEFVDKYCEYSGRDGIPDHRYYVIHSLFRSAAIIQGVYKRGLDGNASSEAAVGFGRFARVRSEAAWRLVEESF